jgi:hypothetical protein
MAILDAVNVSVYREAKLGFKPKFMLVSSVCDYLHRLYAVHGRAIRDASSKGLIVQGTHRPRKNVR